MIRRMDSGSKLPGFTSATNCVSLDKLLYLSLPPFAHMEILDNNNSYLLSK